MVNVELSGQAANDNSGQFIRRAGLSCLSRWSNQTNETNQIDQIYAPQNRSWQRFAFNGARSVGASFPAKLESGWHGLCVVLTEKKMNDSR
jgi:hypothetical protein